MERKKQKNKAAVALSELAHQSMTAAQRKARSRKANEAKRRKAQGIAKQPIWGLRLFDTDEVIDHDANKKNCWSVPSSRSALVTSKNSTTILAPSI